MNKSDLIVGLDIGTTKICAVVGQLNESGAIEVVGIGNSVSTGLRKGVVVTIEQTVQSVRKAVEDAELMAGCEINSVYVGIAGSHIMGINSHGVIAVKGGEVTQRDIERVLDAARAVAIPADREVIHILPQEYIVDNQYGIADPLGMAGVRLEVRVHIVTGAISSAQNIVRSCHRAQLEVSEIALESLASAKAVLTDEEREIGVALVDLGGGTTDIAIFANDAIKHTAVLALGGQNLSNDIAFGLRTPVASAEKIKINIGQTQIQKQPKTMLIQGVNIQSQKLMSVQLDENMLVPVLYPLCEQWAKWIYQFLADLSPEQQEDVRMRGIICCGGTMLLKGLKENLQSLVNCPFYVTDDPQSTVSQGLEILLERMGENDAGR